MEGADVAVSALVADECNRVRGQELSPEEEDRPAELDLAAKIEEVDAWKEFDVFEPQKDEMVSK